MLQSALRNHATISLQKDKARLCKWIDQWMKLQQRARNYQSCWLHFENHIWTFVIDCKFENEHLYRSNNKVAQKKERKNCTLVAAVNYGSPVTWSPQMCHIRGPHLLFCISVIAILVLMLCKQMQRCGHDSEGNMIFLFALQACIMYVFLPLASMLSLCYKLWAIQSIVNWLPAGGCCWSPCWYFMWLLTFNGFSGP